MPCVAVHEPGHPGEVPGLLSAAMAEIDGPNGHSSYLRLSVMTNKEAFPVSPGLRVIKPGAQAVVVAVGLMLDPVLAAVADLDVTAAYTTTVRPFDKEGAAPRFDQRGRAVFEPVTSSCQRAD